MIILTTYRIHKKAWALIEYNSEKLVITDDYHDELDEFKGELIGYIAENKLKIAQLEELMKYFDSKSKKISLKQEVPK